MYNVIWRLPSSSSLLFNSQCNIQTIVSWFMWAILMCSIFSFCMFMFIRFIRLIRVIWYMFMWFMVIRSIRDTCLGYSCLCDRGLCDPFDIPTRACSIPEKMTFNRYRPHIVAYDEWILRISLCVDKLVQVQNLSVGLQWTTFKVVYIIGGIYNSIIKHICSWSAIKINVFFALGCNLKRGFISTFHPTLNFYPKLHPISAKRTKQQFVFFKKRERYI